MNVITTAKKMHAFLPFAIGGTLFNIALNFVLIPKYSFLGASLATLVTEAGVFIIQLSFAHRILHNTGQTLRILGKVFISAVLAAGAFYISSRYVSSFVAAILLLGVYIGGLFVLKVINRQDKQLGLEILQAARQKMSL
jgi:O-antigen/teichoic acid export membrane protein